MYVIHPGALGDVLLSVPALRALKAASPHRTLTLAAQPRIGELVRQLGVVDHSVSFESLGLSSLFVDDSTRAPASLVESATPVVCWFGAGDPVFVRRLRAIAPNAIIAPAARAGTPAWQHLLATVASASDAEWRRWVTVPRLLIDEGRRALIAAGWDGTAPVLMVHPGAGSVAKRWSADGFAAVVNDLVTRTPLTVFIHQGPADRDAVTALSAQLRVPARVIAEPTLPDLAGVLSHVVAYLGNDSGISHLAAAVTAPAVVLFTTATMDWRPWALDARVLRVSTESLDAGDVAVVRNAMNGLVKAALGTRA